MRTPYYREQALEGIAREVITAYDPNLYYGVPRMIPIEDIIEAQGITLEYQCLRKTGCVLGETIFDDGGAIIYDYDIPGYTVIAVKSGTILIDSSLCREDASTGRLRFTCAHELAHWLLHKRLYSGTGESAAMMTETNIVRTQNSALEICHHKMLGVRIAKRQIEPQKPANPCGARLCSCIFFVNTLQKASKASAFGAFLLSKYGNGDFASFRPPAPLL